MRRNSSAVILVTLNLELYVPANYFHWDNFLLTVIWSLFFLFGWQKSQHKQDLCFLEYGDGFDFPGGPMEHEEDLRRSKR